MDKRWYPAAMTVVLVGCSGSDPVPVYGPASPTGGNTATVISTLTAGSTNIDGGVPSTTGGSNGMGGMQTMYGPALTGGASAAGGSAATGGKSPSGGATNKGGTTGIDTGTPSTGGRDIIALYGPIRQSGGNLATDS